MALAGCGKKPAAGPSSYLFVANREGRAVAAVDLGVFSLAKRIALDADPAAVVAHPRRRLVYALSPGDGVLSEISATKLTVTRKLTLAAGADWMRWSHDGALLWVRAGDQLMGVDVAGFAVARRIKLPGVPTDLDLSPETPDGAATFAAAGEVVVLDLAAGRVARTVKLGAESGTLRFLKNGTWILAGRPDERLLTLLDTASGRVVVELPLAVRPDRFCFNADGGQLFINGEGADAVAVVYPFQSQVAATLLAGRKPGAMAASRRPAYLFVANPFSNSVTVIDITTQRVIGAVPVGQEPSAIVMSPDETYALVLNKASGDVSVLWTEGFGKIVRRERSGPQFLVVPVGSAPVSGATVG